MGFLGKASEFFAAPGASVGSFLGDALHNASNFACQLHYNTPGVIFDVSPFNRELWRSLCRDRPSGLPPAPPSAAPFSGGQCPVTYRLTLHIIYKTGPASNPNYYVGDFYGPIQSVRLVRVEPPQSGMFGDLQDLEVVCYGVPGEARSASPRVVRIAPFDYLQSIDNIKVVRVDGQPDNCGDLSTVVKPVVLPASQRTTIINIQTDQNNSVTAILDFPSTSVDFDLSVPLKVTIDNRKFHLNIDGWHTGFPSPSISLPDVEKVLSDNVLQFEGALNQYFAPVNPSINNNLILVSPSAGKKKGGEEKNISGAQWLIWDLTRLPDKAQYGENSPTVYFAGWFSFYKEGRCMERRQINYQRGIVRFPDGADGYGYTFTNGAEGDVSVYKEKPPNG